MYHKFVTIDVPSTFSFGLYVLVSEESVAMFRYYFTDLPVYSDFQVG